MKKWKIQSVKTMFFTAFFFTFCFVLLLNVMIHQLSTDATDTDVNEYSVNQKNLRQLMGPGLQNSDENYIESQGPDRKPKAANEYVSNSNKEKEDYSPNDAYPIELEEKMEPEDGKSDDVLLNNDKKNEKQVVKMHMNEESKEITQDDDFDSDEDDSYDDEAKNEPKGVTAECVQNKNDIPIPLHQKQSTIKDIVVDGLYWSDEVEKLVPKGMSKNEALKWIKVVREGKVSELLPPSWDRCGRLKNGFVVMTNGVKLCARYRHPYNKMVLGEVMSFYLSLMLKMDNVPAALLSKVNESSFQWKGVEPKSLGWENSRYVALIQWIDNLDFHFSHVRIPALLFDMYNTSRALDCKEIVKYKLSPKTIVEIIQWGSMVVFDYLTGNYDRVASMQDGADEQKSQSVIQENIRNLRKSTTTGKFWLIDNESGLLDAYELLYASFEYGERFVQYHLRMLKTMCIFQRSLVEAVKKLQKSEYPHHVLESYVRKHEPHYDSVPRDQTLGMFRKMFKERLTHVTNWINECESRAKR